MPSSNSYMRKCIFYIGFSDEIIKKKRSDAVIAATKGCLPRKNDVAAMREKSYKM